MVAAGSIRPAEVGVPGCSLAGIPVGCNPVVVGRSLVVDNWAVG